MANIRKGDVVEVIAGNDRGKRGRVLRVIPDRDRVVVEGINVRWKHMRKTQKTPQGGRLKRELAIHRSNVMLFDEASGARSRLGSAVAEDGKKTRILRKSGAPVGAAPAAKKTPAKRAAKKAAAKKES